MTPLPEVIARVAGPITLMLASAILDVSALLDLLVEKGVLSPGEFTEHRERYRQAHETEVREEVLRRFPERETPADDAPLSAAPMRQMTSSVMARARGKRTGPQRSDYLPGV